MEDQALSRFKEAQSDEAADADAEPAAAAAPAAAPAPRPPEYSREALVAFVRRKRQELEEKVIRYGPPYHAEYGGNLPEECQDPKVSLMDVHGLLNEGADPRVGDEGDYLNTPLHYCCRHSKINICKILVRAGAVVDQVNELGISALGWVVRRAAMFRAAERSREVARG